MKLTRKTRKVRKKQQREHYVFNSEQHKLDASKARNLRRELNYIVIATEEKPLIEFTNAKKVAFEAVKTGSVVREVTSSEYLKNLEEAGKKESLVYYAETDRVREDGSKVLQKRYSEVRDTYFTMPPWVSILLDGIAEQDPAWVRGVAFDVASKAMETLEARTGYKGLSFAIHPDARHALGYHIQYSMVDDGKLLGRSADGKAGRKGPRFAGDTNLALYRFNKVEAVPGAWEGVVARGDYDDIAIEEAITPVIAEAIEKKYGEEGKKVIDKLAMDYVINWKKRGKTKDQVVKEQLQNRIKVLERENGELKERLTKLERIIGNVGKVFNNDKTL